MKITGLFSRTPILAIILAIIIGLVAPAELVSASMDETEMNETDLNLISPEADKPSEVDLVRGNNPAEVINVADNSDDQIVTNEAPEQMTDVENSELPEIISLPDDEDAADSAPNFIHKDGIVISYVQLGGVDAAEELIEIYNNGVLGVDVTDWCLKYAASNEGSGFNEVNCIKSAKGIGWRVLIPSGSSVVFASDTFIANTGGQFATDYVFSRKLSNTAGRLALFDGNSVLQDAVAWGNSFVDQGNTSVKLNRSELTFGRIFDEQSKVYVDTNDSLNDFTPGFVKKPFKIVDPPDVYDACLNIVGIQELIPTGLYRDKITGVCSDFPPEPVNTCQGVIVSEIAANVSEQFIELHNTTKERIDLNGCHLQTNRSSETHVLQDFKLQSNEFRVINLSDIGLTMTKTTTGTVYLLSSDKSTESNSVSYKNLAKDTSWSLIDGKWQQTYALTPSAENIYQKYPPCETGYFRNEDTGKCKKLVIPADLVDCGEGRERNQESGRCRNVVLASNLMPCKAGQYRSEETNRCRSTASAAASTLKPCKDDQFRNPETNRCRKIASADELADCGEGRERNPETNRCRNVLAATISDAPFAPEKINEVAKSTLGWWAFGGVSLLAVGYAAWQWRFEVSKLTRRVAQLFSSGSQS